MALRKKMLAVLLLALIVFTGCSKQVILHPVEGVHIFVVEAGKEFVSELDGCFVSEYYMKEIMRVKVGE